MLSLYRPTPYMAGCSQAVWQRDGRPLLVRNYDYFPERLEGTILMSAWNGVKTIVQSDCLWGVLDGMNEHGLAASLAFGGDDYGRIALTFEIVFGHAWCPEEIRRADGLLPIRLERPGGAP